MSVENRHDLIDRAALGIGRCDPDLFPFGNRPYCAGWNGVINLLEAAPTVEAVPAEQYDELQKRYIDLREQYDKVFTEYHELRDAFIDYVCGGVPNPSPFCKNIHPGCCDSRGWCKNDDNCKGFRPADVFTDKEVKNNGG